ncbi:unnamed protein product, partial [Brassica napus]
DQDSCPVVDGGFAVGHHHLLFSFVHNRSINRSFVVVINFQVSRFSFSLGEFLFQSHRAVLQVYFFILMRLLLVVGDLSSLFYLPFTFIPL